MDEGWTRYVFEKEMGVAYRNIHAREVRAGRLRERFDAIVLPDIPGTTLLNGHAPGSLPEEYTGGLGLEGALALERFVEGGGWLVAFDEAVDFAIDQLGLPVRNVVAGLPPQDFFVPGSLIRVDVDVASDRDRQLPEAFVVVLGSGVEPGKLTEVIDHRLVP